MRTLVRVVQDLVLLAARFALGLVLVVHGWHRYRRVGLARETAYLQAHHVPQAQVLAYGATALELIGGVLLAFGFAVPLVGLAVAVENVLVIVWLKWHAGLSLVHGGYESNLVLAAAGLLLFAFGAGRAGLDQMFRRAGSGE